MVEPNSGNGVRDNNQFTQIIYGDGGNAGYDLDQPELALQPVHQRVQRLELRERRPDKWVI